MALMETKCIDNTATFGPQVLIDGKPWSVSHIYMCDMKMHLTHPIVIVQGTDVLQCEEEHQGVIKIKTRNIPITVETTNGIQVTITDASDACGLWNAMELIHGIW